MRHQVSAKKFDRTSAHRKAMFANMATSLILHDRIETTLPKARVLKPMAEKLVTMGKKKNVAARRRAISIVRSKDAVKKLFDELAIRFADRNGGYTRILKLGRRHGDNSPMCAIEYLPSPHKIAEEGERAAKKAAAKKEKHGDKHEKKAAPKPAQKIHEKKVASSKKAAAVDVKHKRSSPTHKATRGD